MERRLSVPEIHCEHCKTSIEDAVGKVDGVVRAVVDVDSRTVEIDFDDELVDMSVIVGAIEEQGYEVPQS